MPYSNVYYGITFSLADLPKLFPDEFKNTDDTYRFDINKHVNITDGIEIIQTDSEFSVNNTKQDFTFIIGICISTLWVFCSGVMDIPNVSDKVKQYFNNFIKNNLIFLNCKPKLCIHTETNF